MPRITLMPALLVFLIPIRSAACAKYFLLFSGFAFDFLSIRSRGVCLQMCWSQFLCSLVSLPISIFPEVENTG